MRSGISATAALAAAAVLALFGCGGSGSSEDAIKEAEHKGAERAQQHTRINQIERELRELRHGGSSSRHAIHEEPAPESGTAPEGNGGSSGNCGGGLSANQYTTCGFAEAVEVAYFAEIGSGAGTVEAYSQTTQQTYSMYCTAGEPHECTGGNNAAVFFP